MRRVDFLPLLAVAALSLGCPSNAPELPARTAPRLLSRVETADPRAAPQMIEGFYPLEQRLWCWTARKFAVSLAAPPPVAGLPVELDLRFTLPEVIVEKAGAVTITARIGGVEIGSQVYDQAGVGLAFDVEVPGDLLGDEQTVVAFELDKSWIADEKPRRELGIVFLSAALQ